MASITNLASHRALIHHDKDVCLVVVIVLMVSGLFYDETSPAQPVKPSCVTSEERIIIRAAVLAAIEDGLKDQMKFLSPVRSKTRRINRNAHPQVCRVLSLLLHVRVKMR